MDKQKVAQEIKNIVRQLVGKYKPEKIILFGSAVKGKFTSDSDLDFFILKSNVPFYGIDRMREVRNLVETDFPCDFLVAKPSEVKQRLSLGDPFVKGIFEKGKVLYG